jgi:hypothetical protein
MSVVARAVLLDGALLHGKPTLVDFARQPELVSLYADIDEGAALVGPYLLIDKTTTDIDSMSWPLPERLAASDLEARGSSEDMIAHLLSIRFLRLADGTKFFLRFADMRAMAETLQAVRGSYQAQQLIGPITSWRFVGRDGKVVDLVDIAAIKTAHESAKRFPRASSSEVVLTERQLDGLLDGTLSDRLAHAVVEINEPNLNPVTSAEQFVLIQAAADFIRQHLVESFSMQRAIALSALTSHGRCFAEEQFAIDVRDELRHSNGAERIAAWTSKIGVSPPSTVGSAT